MFPANNPFTQGSWRSGNAPSSNGSWDSSVPPPSIFGALPYPNAPSLDIPIRDLITFRFSSFNPTILNCQVMGPRSQPVFYVITDSSLPGYTQLKDAAGANVALVEWQSHPLVEARGAVAKQPIRNWLRLSSDQRHRLMGAHGINYYWAPNDRFICLYTSGSSTSPLARISKSYNDVILEMTPQAIQFKLLEICVVATILLQCGRNID
ncbi:hypothetical protein SERLA73DRAFT_175544 [Serpula lacrymans var. lacrymans S7.3]|uniref:DUF6593 domain-containing protein n=2 Tax=Serpula lacrymans var. lacrymans TaxID=341189 RepID=F8PKE7_SERL3|nr:uncharacterized protein SERLADRAFT_458051 [Serpula lacrymans var. lacrymans S7.9]EGO03861.1 hypothetical protein SERLA73DRAFT_175544 [Serpula lacrymans var. lacrymans S7.3]EGO29787.1 hypothetical protein SERLADRAFT_458051 [Serpula lacrymans var. lacrymans S7.9]